MLKKSPTIILVIISTILISLTVNLYLNKIKESVYEHNQHYKELITSEVKKIRSQYFNELLLFKYYFEHGKDIQEIISMKHNIYDSKINIFDMENLEVIIVTDKSDNIIHARYRNEDKTSQHLYKSLKRSYIDELRSSKDPHLIMFGDIIQGEVSNKLIIPIAIGLYNKNNDFQGTIIFSLILSELYSLLKNITHDMNVQNVSIEKTALNYELKNLSSLEAMKILIGVSNSSITYSFYNDIVKGFVNLSYDISLIVENARYSILLYLMIIGIMTYVVSKIIKYQISDFFNSLWLNMRNANIIKNDGNYYLTQGAEDRVKFLVQDLIERHNEALSLATKHKYINKIFENIFKLLNSNISELLSANREKFGDVIIDINEEKQIESVLYDKFKYTLSILYKLNIDNNNKISTLLNIIHQELPLLKDEVNQVNLKNLLIEMGANIINEFESSEPVLLVNAMFITKLIEHLLKYLNIHLKDLTFYIDKNERENYIKIDIIINKIIDPLKLDSLMQLKIQMYALFSGGIIAVNYGNNNTKVLLRLLT